MAILRPHRVLVGCACGGSGRARGSSEGAGTGAAAWIAWCFRAPNPKVELKPEVCGASRGNPRRARVRIKVEAEVGTRPPTRERGTPGRRRHTGHHGDGPGT